MKPFLVLSAASLTLLPILALAQPATSPGAAARPNAPVVGFATLTDPINVARSVVKTFFPDLIDKVQWMSITMARRTFDPWREPLSLFALMIQPRNRDLVRTPEPREAGTPLNSTFEFFHGRFGDAYFYNDCNRFGRYKDLLDAVRQNGDWSDEQAVRYLAGLGGRFGPDQEMEFRSALPTVVDLERLFDGRIHQTDVAFTVRQDSLPVPDPKMALAVVWVVQERSVTRRYRGVFEPFEGKLLNLSELRNID